MRICGEKFFRNFSAIFVAFFGICPPVYSQRLKIAFLAKTYIFYQLTENEDYYQTILLDLDQHNFCLLQ